MGKRCFVIQRFDGARYDKLYEQIFKPAIEKAGFEPYRVDRDPSASIPIEAIEREISKADACFAELSEDAPNVWFELGYAIARDKPLCLACSKARAKFPFDVQHRQIIKYPEQPLPNEYDDLGKRITERLNSVSQSNVVLNQSVETDRALSLAPRVSGLKAHELIALTVIFAEELTGEATAGSLTREMERSGFTRVATSLAVASLLEKCFIEAGKYQDFNGYEYVGYKAAAKGKAWLIDHQDELNLRFEKSAKMDSIELSSLGITDDDIPF